MFTKSSDILINVCAFIVAIIASIAILSTPAIVLISFLSLCGRRIDNQPLYDCQSHFKQLQDEARFLKCDDPSFRKFHGFYKEKRQ